MNVSLTINRRELQRFKGWLNSIDVKQARKTKLALIAAGKEMESVGKINTPVGTPESTGIKGYQGGTLRQGNQSASILNGYGVKYFNDVDYAKYVNNGTSRMKARPFFDKGFEAGVKKFRQIMSK